MQTGPLSAWPGEPSAALVPIFPRRGRAVGSDVEFASPKITEKNRQLISAQSIVLLGSDSKAWKASTYCVRGPV